MSMGFWDAYNESREASMGALKQHRVGGALAKGDYAGAASEAFRLGDYQLGTGLQGEVERRGQIDRRNALGQEVGAAAGLSDPTERKTALRNAATSAYGQGDFDAGASIEQQIGQLDTQQINTAKRNADELGKVAYSLQRVPYEQRKKVIESMAPALLQSGFSKEQIEGFDPSDQNLSGMVGQALDLKDQLELAAKAAEDKARDADRQADNKRADADAAERQRHNQASEGVASGRLGVQRSREGRMGAGGGSSAPGGAPWQRKW